MLKRWLAATAERCGYGFIPLSRYRELCDREKELSTVRESLAVVQEALASTQRNLAERQRVLDELKARSTEFARSTAEQQRLERENESLRRECASRTAELQAIQSEQKQLQAVAGNALTKGIPQGSPAIRACLHVGFGHAATTSLQENFFSQRADLHYLGIPFGVAGGLFSNLKYLEDSRLDSREMESWYNELIRDNPAARGKTVVVSEETFCENSEIFYTPRHLPQDMIALRLKRLFPGAKIVFTIRHQVEYAASMYLNIKRNYAFLAGMPLPPFEEWWEGMHSQVRTLYLQNLDYSRMIGVYSDLFGEKNLLVLPLEELKRNGSRAYLERLCRFMEIELHDADVERFAVQRNERMTVVEERLAEIVAARHSGLSEMARTAAAREPFSSLAAGAPKAKLEIGAEIVERIRSMVSAGNRRLQETFGLPLKEMGYFV